ncbi:MAG: amidohydrolase family protein [Bacteroidetes bacterium]|nr:amidohydrolase family protein [Bacteroidota bacterium]
MSAKHIFNGTDFLPENSVIALSNKNEISDILSISALDETLVEYFEGILCPGFINAHCHLELSHLKNKITQHTGLPKFAMQVVKNRTHFNKEVIEQAAFEEDCNMYKNGIVAVGDICNTATTISVKQQSPIYYHSFIELMGLDPNNSDKIITQGIELSTQFSNDKLPNSFAPHAPYSTSIKLIRQLIKLNANAELSTSIHHHESLEEILFLNKQKSDFDILYSSLGLTIDYFKGLSQTDYLSSLKTDFPLITVHNTFSNKEAVDAIINENLFFCFCPSANLYIESTLPQFNDFLNYHNNCCIGTDSLASNDSLNIVKEATIILKNSFNTFSIENILKMICNNGAKALGIDSKYGSLSIGTQPGINLIELKNNSIEFKQKVV